MLFVAACGRDDARQTATALIRLRAAADHVREFACHEGNHHVVRGILGGARAHEK